MEGQEAAVRAGVEDRPGSSPALEALSDEELVELAQRGMESATEFLLKKYQRLVQVWTKPYFLQGGDNDDLLQEGMIGLYKAIRDFAPGGTSFSSFARLCIVRHVITAIKGTTRRKHLPLNSYTSLHKAVVDSGGDRTLLEVLANTRVDDPESLVIDRERLAIAKRQIRELLSKFEYEVFKLYVNGLSYREMARLLSTQPKAIDNALCRIKHKIGRTLS
ncbi:MAG: RNA polymerase sporulation sigma factor SigH [Bacillota bacterium]|nr:RNA polymerase sporulation sigma factor SigH [Bacillota bacterium]